MDTYGKLARLCATLRILVYTEGDDDAAKAHLSELRSLLDETPTDDISIIGAEGHAIYYELTGNINQALASRLREVALMLLLYSDIRKDNNPKWLKKQMLAGRDKGALNERKAIIRTLRRKLRELGRE